MPAATKDKDETVTTEAAPVEAAPVEGPVRKPDPDAVPRPAEVDVGSIEDQAVAAVLADRWVPGSEIRDSSANPLVKQAQRKAASGGIARNSDRGLAAAKEK